LFLYDPCAKSQGIKQLMSGAGVGLTGIGLVPMLADLFSEPAAASAMIWAVQMLL
jgi:hypothetical protein